MTQDEWDALTNYGKASIAEIEENCRQRYLTEKAAGAPIYQGDPPLELLINEATGDYHWLCECGRPGVSSTPEWANSDVERHRQRVHKQEKGD